MKTDDDILDDIIKDGSVEIDVWPDLLKRLLSRLDAIVHDNFPKFDPSTFTDLHDIDIIDVAPSQLTVADTIPTQPTTPPETQDTQDLLVFSQEAVADSAFRRSPQPLPPPPTILSFPSPPPPPPLPLAATPSTPPAAAGDEVDHSFPADPAMHPVDLERLAVLRKTLEAEFSGAPPHTVQRLAELLRYPNRHYHCLPKYLRALERVLSVSSTSAAFPLAQNPTEAMQLSNGNNGNANGFGLGSDESLGGALLTPIPWLTPTSLTDGDGGAEGRALSPGDMNGMRVTQGELLGQEQELGAIPANRVMTGEREDGGRGYSEGPPALGPADVGPQPAGTVFPDPPKSPEEALESPPRAAPRGGIDAVVERVNDEEMKDAPKEEAKEVAGGNMEDAMQVDTTSEKTEEAKSV